MLGHEHRLHSCIFARVEALLKLESRESRSRAWANKEPALQGGGKAKTEQEQHNAAIKLSQVKLKVHIKSGFRIDAMFFQLVIVFPRTVPLRGHESRWPLVTSVASSLRLKIESYDTAINAHCSFLLVQAGRCMRTTFK